MTVLRTILAGLCLTLPAASAAARENLVSYVSSKGSDVQNDQCSEQRPCRTLMTAMFETRNGGTIVCLDSGYFGDTFGSFLWIMKPITVDCTGHAASIHGVIMRGRPCPGCFVEGPLNFPDGPNFVVVLRGLTINADFLSNTSVDFTVGRALHLEHCTIAGTIAGGAGGGPNPDFDNPGNIGVLFAPSQGESRLHISDSIISVAGIAPGDPARPDGGIVIKPKGPGAARVILNRVKVHQNTFGIVADGTASTGGIAMTISDSMTGGNLQDGVLAISKTGQAPIRVTLDRVRVLNNDKNGVRSSGPNVAVRLTDSIVTGNNAGVTFDAGGMLLSAGNNLVEANAASGSFSGSFKLK